MSRTIRGCLLVSCVLLAAAGAAAGQEGAEKRVAIRKLLETGGAARQSQLIFEKLLERFKEPFAVSMIADLRGKGYFKALSAEEGAELERRIRVFLGDVFDETRARADRGFTPELLEQIAAPAYDKYLTLDEVNQLIAFEQSPLGRRLKVLMPEAVAEGFIASLEAKGVFNVPPEEMTARLAQSQRELQSDPARGAKDMLTASAFAKRLTPDEVKELEAFRVTPFGKKIVEVYPRMQGEIQSNFWALYGQRMAPILGGVYKQKLYEYAPWLSEATKPGARRGAPPPTPADIVAPSKRP